MKTKTYKFGTHTLKSHFKTAGHGYEVTFYWGNESLFVGNFVHKSEATKWWATMNIELRKFTKKYWVADNASAAFYKKFFANHLYRTYYACLDKWFSKYTKTYNHAFKSYEKKYMKMKKRFSAEDKVTFRHSA